jgi:predicted MFS family arabinose efflux permease
MLAVLRRRDYFLLWVAGVASTLGDFVLLIALPFHVYEVTGSALATGGTYVAGALPRVLLGSVAGVFVDRWDRKRTMIAADLVRAAALLALLTVPGSDGLWVVYVVTVIESSVSQFFGPARAALLPRLVPEEQRQEANALGALGEGASRLAGPLIGGALLGLLGLQGVVLFDSASFLLSAILIAMVAAPTARPVDDAGGQRVATAAAGRAAAVLRELREGLEVVGREPIVRATFVVTALTTVAFGITDPLIPVFMQDVLGGTAVDFGALASVQGVGVMLGGLAIARARGAVAPAGLIALGLGLGAALLLVGVHSGSFPVVLALIGPWGACLVAYQVGATTLLQNGVPDALRGRVFGALGTLQGALGIAGIALASVLGTFVGAVWVLTAACLLLLAAAGVAAAMPRDQADSAVARADSTVGAADGAGGGCG